MLPKEIENIEDSRSNLSSPYTSSNRFNKDVDFTISADKRNSIEVQIEELQIHDTFDIFHSTPLAPRKKSLFSVPELNEISEISDDEDEKLVL